MPETVFSFDALFLNSGKSKFKKSVCFALASEPDTVFNQESCYSKFFVVSLFWEQEA